jgi:hypothetical protein
MGIFSKIGKSIKKVFSKIGKGIKKQFQRFGKFMGKAGILGQIAMMFILPGIGNALMSGISGAFGSIVGQTAAQAGAATASAGAAGAAGATAGAAGAAAGASVAGAGATGASAIAGSGVAGAGAAAGTLGQATGMMASKSALIRGAGHVLQAAGNFVKVGSKAFSTVTEGISSFIGEFSKTALNKIPGVNIGSAAPTAGQAWTNVQNSVMKNASGTVEAFNTAIGIEPTAGTTKFGTAGYTVPDRVSVDSIAAAKNVTDIAATDSLIDGGTLESVMSGPETGFRTELKAAPQQRIVTSDMTEAEIGRVDAYNSALEREAGRATAQQSVYGDSQFVKTASSPDSLLNPKDNFKAKEFMDSDYFKNNFSTTPIEGAIEYDFSGTKAYIDAAKFAEIPNINTFQNFQTGKEGLASKTGLFNEIGQSIKDIPTNLKASLLEAPQQIADMPGKFVDNFTSTVTNLPNMAARAALNRPAAQTANYYKSVASAIPESTYGMNQSNVSESGVAVAGYQNKGNPSALYGNQSQAYDQFFKMMGPQPQQMRA